MSLSLTPPPFSPTPSLTWPTLPPSDLLAGLLQKLDTMQPEELKNLLAQAQPGSHKLLLDQYMRKNFPDLWHAAQQQAQQLKAEFYRPSETLSAANTAAASVPRMLSKMPTDQEQAFLQGPLHYQSDQTHVEAATGRGIKRVASSEEDDGTWRPMITGARIVSNDKTGSIQSLFNEPSLLSCKPSEMSGTPGDQHCSYEVGNVFLDYTGPRPGDAAWAFSFPILIDRDLRVLAPASFRAIVNRLHTVAVNVMTIGNECEQITPHQPASCKTFTSGAQITQIDKFFSENRAQFNASGVAVIDGAVIESWGKESSLRGMSALAIRPNKFFFWFSIGFCSFFFVFISSMLAIFYPKLSGLSNWRCRGEPVTEEKPEPNTDQGLESSVVIDSADSETPEAYQGDFSSSSSTSEASETLSAAIDGAEGQVVASQTGHKSESDQSS